MKTDPPVDRALELVTHLVNRDRLRTLLDFTGTILYRSYTPDPFLVHGEEILGG